MFIRLAPHTTGPEYAALRELARAYGLTVPYASGLRTPPDIPLDQARESVHKLRDAASRLGYHVINAPAVDRMRHREAVPQPEMHHGDLAVFAPALAAHLPGTWTVDVRDLDPAFREFDVTNRVWDEGHLWWIVSSLRVNRAAVLTGRDETELIVVDRPYGKRPFMVGALSRANVAHLPLHIPPNAVSVPFDPRLAAERVTRRLLPAYRRAIAAIAAAAVPAAIPPCASRPVGRTR